MRRPQTPQEMQRVRMVALAAAPVVIAHFRLGQPNLDRLLLEIEASVGAAVNTVAIYNSLRPK